MAENYAESCLIVFVKGPVAGKVKTRLAKSIGADHAANVYKALLAHTYRLVLPVPFSRCIYYDDHVVAEDLWSAGGFEKYLQTGDTLGNKMANAFEEQFQRGYKHVIIIGSDNPELSTADIMDAETRLENHDVVIGPASDGGYYLLGLNKPIPALLQGMPWSSSRLLAYTIMVLEKESLRYALLPVRRDIDTGDDYRQLKHLL